MGLTTKISPEYEIEIPEELRGKEGWKPGQEVAFVATGSTVTLVPAGEFDRLRGIAKGANPDGYRDRDDRY